MKYKYEIRKRKFKNQIPENPNTQKPEHPKTQITKYPNKPKPIKIYVPSLY